MPRIVPFEGLRYNLGKAGDPGKLVAPPYDVITEQRRQADSRSGFAAQASSREFREVYDKPLSLIKSLCASK